ncbi:hypothetical protein ACS0TY_019400 [Phlomoides rotata]
MSDEFHFRPLAFPMREICRLFLLNSHRPCSLSSVSAQEPTTTAPTHSAASACFISESLGGPTRDWTGIYEECFKILYEEIDYVNEAKNAEGLCRDF